MAAANDEPYDLHQRIMSKQLGERLATMTGKLRTEMGNHALASAFIGTGLNCAIQEHGAAGAADWLRKVADAIESGGGGDLEHIMN
ncbi:hypothetical protein KD146_13455 [Devosia sp. BSSL-BM10]|uniref:Uncharacterized protein n=1 Tax=Devosia litorisediminis TaxID=2829817 RepID=A0A942ED20_9HYPH|nr:hypothetical protein [Devosia litorisediminis]MBS3849705.1 hypothetical protein [Devosia litorisediminis]